MSLEKDPSMHGGWWNGLLGSVLALAALHLVDAFFVEVPLLSVVLAVLFLLSAYWLSSRTRASVVFAGALCLARLGLAIAFSIAGPTESLSNVEVVLVASFGITGAVGVIAAAGALRARRLDDRS